MSTKSANETKSDERRNLQVQYLAHRWAITLMLLRRQVDIKIATLPSMADMRESLRGDEDYEPTLNLVRELLRREVGG